MSTGREIKNAIEQITTVKSLLRFETKDGLTEIYKPSKCLGWFKRENDKFHATRYGNAPVSEVFEA